MRRLLAAVLVTHLAACAAEEAEPVGYGEGFGTPENPIPQDDSYEVASRIEITAGGVVPPEVALAVADLRAFSDSPGRTLLTLADEAGVPALQELYGGISTALRDRLEGWINTEIDKVKIAGKTLRQYTGEIAVIAETALTRIAVDSSLLITPTKATHTLTGLNFKPSGIDIVVPIGGFAADVVTQRTTVSVGEGGALTLGEQRFGLALGDHAWQGVNLASTSLFGGDLRTTLVNTINCPVLAKTISTKCYNGVCVGHESQLRAICDGAVNTAVGGLRERMTAFKLDVFRLIAGSAHLLDDNQNGVAEQIVDGVWDSEMNLGLGLRKSPGTFTATQ